MKKRFILLALAISFGILPFQLKASHYMGGEITWECKSSGKFVFTLKYYRECSGITFPNTLSLSSNSPVSTIPMTLQPGYPVEISPVCNPDTNFLHISCTNVPTQTLNSGAIEVYVYKSAEVLLNGVPPTTGWEFYHASCCRNPSTSFTGQPGWRVYAKMFPYNGQSTFPCFDSSPDFAELPEMVMSTGYPVSIFQHAYDPDADELKFEWGQPLDDNNSPISIYSQGYSYTTPLPGASHNSSNVQAVLDTNNGMIDFTSYTTGAFVTAVQLNAYRNGIKVAEVMREMQLILRPTTGSNLPPVISPVFLHGDGYTDTVVVGDTVSFSISATDFQMHPNGLPQEMSYEYYGQQFGDFVSPVPGASATLSSSQGCANPPCATLTPAPGPGYPASGQFGLQANFYWQVDCSHVDPNSNSPYTRHEFIFKFSDDYCPVPASGYAVVKIFVENVSVQNQPPANLVVTSIPGIPNKVLQWDNTPVDQGNFHAYYIYESSSMNGAYILIDSVMNYHQTTYDLSNALAMTQDAFYYIKTAFVHPCQGIAGSSASSIVQVLISDIEEADAMELSLVPNPTNGIAYVEMNIMQQQHGQLTIYDAKGKLVHEQELKLDQGLQKLEVDLRAFENGVYYLHLQLEQTSQTGKIVLQR